MYFAIKDFTLLVEASIGMRFQGVGGLLCCDLPTNGSIIRYQRAPYIL